jgi:acyl-CoA dehydrogenase
MFDPTLTPEQEQLVETARRFAAEKLVPNATEWDRSETFPTETFREAWNLGLMNVELPEQYGGVGLHTFDGCLVSEELSFGCAAVATSIMCNHLGALPLLIAGTDAQKQQWLSRLGERLEFVSYACSEPDAGSDVAGMKTKIVRDGSGWRLTGQKRWITNAGHAGFFTGFATMDPALRHKGITAFVVSADTPGVSTGRKEDKLGQRASDTRDVIFDDVRLTDDQILGRPGEGFAIAMETFDRSRPMIAALAAGIIRRCAEESRSYALERKAFGAPISQHQAVQFMIAEMVMSYEMVRLLWQKAAWEVDNGVKRSSTSAIAKAWGGDLAMKCAVDAVQVFGGYGYTKEYPVEKLMRDAKLLQIYEGTSQVQRMVIARNFLFRS